MNYKETMKEVRKRCKKLLLRDGYGKFALVEKVISADRLLKMKPMVIYLELQELLGDQSAFLNRNSFYSWLRRWRRLNKENKSLPAQKEKNWMDYQPASSSPVAEEKDGVVLEFIKPQ